MTTGTEIRASRPADAAHIDGLYRDAFPDEELRPLVAALLTEPTGVVSLVAVRSGATVGHVVCTFCTVDGADCHAALLGPLAVAPSAQRQGIGAALVHTALADMAARGFARTLVLGDPDYYGRFGFLPERDISPPYPLAAEWRTAWQAVRHANGSTDCSGTLQVPAPWRHEAYWMP